MCASAKDIGKRMLMGAVMQRVGFGGLDPQGKVKLPPRLDRTGRPLPDSQMDL